VSESIIGGRWAHGHVGVVCLDTEQDQVHAARLIGFSDDFRGHCEVARQKCAQAQTSAADLVELFPAGNERHIVTGSR